MQMFRRMVFNVIISNRDDYAKNFSFQYINDKWKLSPAYDLLPSNGFNGFYTTTINGQGEPTLKAILVIAKEVGIKDSEADNIIDEIAEICIKREMKKFKYTK